MNTLQNSIRCLAAIGLACATPQVMALSFNAGDTEVKIGGHIKLDVIATDYEAVPANSLEPLGRDYYAGPRSVPLDDGSGGVTLLDFHAKQTRLNLKTTTPFGDKTLTSFIEIDFQNSDAGNETISNSYQPRLRQAFIKYDNWLLGQTWSTFQNVAALPETVDFIGPSESTVFIRQPMIRYYAGPLQIAVENPHSRIGGATPDTRDDNTLPDLALRLNVGPLVVTGLLRSLESQDQGGLDESTLAGGLSISGKLALGRDDLKFMLTGGTGLGRYLGVISNLDAVVDASGDIEPLETVAGYLAYRHWWSPKARSSVVLGLFQGDDENGDIEEASSIHINYMYSPVKPLTLGLELMQARRENVGGAEGEFTRMQFGAKLAF